MNWNKMLHDFGSVPNNTTHYTTFTFLGDEETRKKLIIVPMCGCTSTTWNGNIMNVGLNVLHDKKTVVRINYPDGTVEELILKGQGK